MDFGFIQFILPDYKPVIRAKRITMIKSIQVFVLIIFLFNVSFGQSFEGKVVYKTTYKSKIPNISDATLTQMMGTRQDYYLRGGDYRLDANGTFLQWQLYLKKDNRLYNKLSNSEALLYNDGSVNPDEVLHAEIKRNVTEILGYKCDELTLTCKSGVQLYYFNSKLKIDPVLFQQFKFGNWFEYLSRSRALPLKMIIDSPQFSAEIEATEIRIDPVDPSIFALPENVSVQKSPY